MSQTSTRKSLKFDPHKQNRNEVYELISWWKTEEVSQAKVMVVGAGALGNEVLKNLALLNVGHILIVDFDTIEHSNLSRSVLFRQVDCEGNKNKAEVAAERLKEINPGIKTMTINGDITIDVGLGIFQRMDAIIGCLDNRIARLFINRLCHKTNKTWIDGAIENMAGQLSVYKPGTSCYECELTDVEWKHIRNRMGCPDVARRAIKMGRVPTTPISSSIIAAMQVQEALKIIHGYEDKSMAGQKFFYEGMNNTVLMYKAPGQKEDCLSHYTYEPIIKSPELSSQTSIKDTLDWLSRHFEEAHPRIELDHTLALEITTQKSEKSHEIVIAKPHLAETDLQKYMEVPGEEIFITQDTDIIDKNFHLPERSLESIGIPPLHIITVLINGERHFVELSGDETYLSFE